jgi:hypothetical protein
LAEECKKYSTRSRRTGLKNNLKTKKEKGGAVYQLPLFSLIPVHQYPNRVRGLE